MDKLPHNPQSHQWHPTQHNMKRRSPWHNYRLRGYYMLTLVVQDRRPLLGTLRNCNGTAVVEPTPLGQAIIDAEVAKIPAHYPQVDVWKFCLMPDHLHMIVRVKEDLPPGIYLGQIICGFKAGCNQAYWQLNNLTTTPRPGLFEPGYNDKILLENEQFDRWEHYLDDNPRRLLLKRQNPELFTQLSNRQIADHTCTIVGNRFLLDIPDKVAVIVHRRYSADEVVRLHTEWLDCGERGGVLVSAAIAPTEQEVLHEAMERGYRIILLRENGFPELYKPTGRSFDACSAGLLLQVSPFPYHMEQKTISRAQCLELNEMAERIARNEQ